MVRVRTEREIELIAESAQIVADTLDMLSERVKSGVTLLKLDMLSEKFIRSQGAIPAFKGYMGFPATLCISVNVLAESP
jgi:methionyl aminopeptidase